MNILKTDKQLSITERLDLFIHNYSDKLNLLLICLISLFALISISEYLNLRNQLELKNKHETVLVMVAKQDLAIGQKLDSKLCELIPYSSKMVKKIEENKGRVFFHEDELIQFLNSHENGILAAELLRGELIRKSLFKTNSTSTIAKLLPDGHSVIDLQLDLSTSRKFLKVGDVVKLYRRSKTTSHKFKYNGKIILLDKVSNTDNSKEALELSLAIPNLIYREVLSAKETGKLEIVLEKNSIEDIQLQTKHSNKNFQKLLVNDSKQIKVFKL